MTPSHALDPVRVEIARIGRGRRKLRGVRLAVRALFYGWVAVAVVIVVGVSFALIYREGQTRVDQIQESRVSSCEITEAAKKALIERDIELVNIAVEVAEGDPETGQAILDQLNHAPSAVALEPLDCREVIAGD